MPLKDIFATLNIRDLGMIYQHQYDRAISPFREGLLSPNAASLKFRYNKTPANISNLFDMIYYIPVNNVSVILGWVFLG